MIIPPDDSTTNRTGHAERHGRFVGFVSVLYARIGKNFRIGSGFVSFVSAPPSHIYEICRIGWGDFVGFVSHPYARIYDFFPVTPA